LINNIAVAAEYLIQKKGAKKLALLDLDLHHGNGTQDIFYSRSDISYISIHQFPFYPGTGALGETGQGDGQGYTLNLPVPGQSGDQAYLTLLKEVVIPYLDQVSPEMLLISYGFDTHWKDPLGSMLVSAGSIYSQFSELMIWVERECDGRLAVILEGGYDLSAGEVCGQAVGAALTQQEWKDPLGPAPLPEGVDWKYTLEQAKNI
jgi:acetoin utilization deacetylase AcuC-like enzyme